MVWFQNNSGGMPPAPYFYTISWAMARGLKRYHKIVLKKTDSPPHTVFRGPFTNPKVKQLDHLSGADPGWVMWGTELSQNFRYLLVLILNLIFIQFTISFLKVKYSKLRFGLLRPYSLAVPISVAYVQERCMQTMVSISLIWLVNKVLRLSLRVCLLDNNTI